MNALLLVELGSSCCCLLDKASGGEGPRSGVVTPPMRPAYSETCGGREGLETKYNCRLIVAISW